MAARDNPMTIPASSTGAPRWVTPRIHTRKRKVPINSKIKAESALYSLHVVCPKAPFQPEALPDKIK
jgi:hypothetical protein